MLPSWGGACDLGDPSGKSPPLQPALTLSWRKWYACDVPLVTALPSAAGDLCSAWVGRLWVCPEFFLLLVRTEVGAVSQCYPKTQHHPTPCRSSRNLDKTGYLVGEHPQEGWASGERRTVSQPHFFQNPLTHSPEEAHTLVLMGSALMDQNRPLRSLGSS